MLTSGKDLAAGTEVNKTTNIKQIGKISKSASILK